MQLSTMNYQLVSGLAKVTFNRPEKLNSINEDVIGDLETIATLVESRPNAVNALVFQGTGKAFCVGLDLALLERAFADMSYFESLLRRYNAALNRIDELPIPTIAAVNGYARAGGIELCLACDFIIIADEAKIGDAHTSSGVMPGGGSTQRLPRRIGEQRAKELIFTARWLSGQEAVVYGLALKSVPHSELDTSVEAFAASLIDKPAPCLAAAKAAINEGRDVPIRDAIEVELRHFMEYTKLFPEAREGYQAFREGRKPNWKK